MTTTAKLKTWGNSLGVVVPKDLVRAEHLEEGDEVIIQIKKKHSIKEIFGSLKDLNIDSQKMKDQLRKEWAK
jgi:antitoxin component of MazEF toxin-antitoxin module